jgi:hypothetical protein
VILKKKPLEKADFDFLIFFQNLVHDKKGCDTMGERIGRIGRIETDFFGMRVLGIRQKIKEIRSYPPDPPNPFSHCITVSQTYIFFPRIAS